MPWMAFFEVPSIIDRVRLVRDGVDMVPDSFSCYLVHKTDNDRIESAVAQRPIRDLPPGNVLIQVAYSSLNFKDAMAAQGHPGIVKRFPHVPGIDAAGTVIASESSAFNVGDRVIATGHELGVERWGGWAEYVRVPAAWVVPLPESMALEESMVLGTAGFTAAQTVASLIHHGITPDSGELMVTGATGGVGSIVIQILAKLGYQVVALTGKQHRHQWLKRLGAARVLGRDALADKGGRPLLSAQYAGAIDTVGGKPLATLIKSIKYRGCVACCGVVAGTDLPLTVYPFILRGVTLDGIDSAWCPDYLRVSHWHRLANEWRIQPPQDFAARVSLDEVGKMAERMLAGQITGRIVVRPVGD